MRKKARRKQKRSVNKTRIMPTISEDDYDYDHIEGGEPVPLMAASGIQMGKRVRRRTSVAHGDAGDPRKNGGHRRTSVAHGDAGIQDKTSEQQKAAGNETSITTMIRPIRTLMTIALRASVRYEKMDGKR